WERGRGDVKRRFSPPEDPRRVPAACRPASFRPASRSRPASIPICLDTEVNTDVHRFLGDG
ncbi:MAG: hypothetical protein ACK5FE_02415, partial [Cyanobacteriota bacterium]